MMRGKIVSFISKNLSSREKIIKSASTLLQQGRTFANDSNESAASFTKIGVIGLGLMGHGICQVAATAAPQTTSIIAYETQDTFLQKGKDRIEKSLEKLISKEKITREYGEAIMDSILFTTDKDAFADPNLEFIVEAIIEDICVKNALYKELDSICPSSTIFASNTSSLSITEMSLAVSASRQERFMGIHFFNPVQIMKLVEVIRLRTTLPSVNTQVTNWVKHIQKVPVSCHDTPGFIVNRLLVPNMAQAMLMVDRNEASVKDIDISMQLGAGNPMGPLHLADYVGLDTCLSILKGWVEKYPNESAFVVPNCLVEKVERGDFGRKSGKGFYLWDADKRGDVAS